MALPFFDAYIPGGHNIWLYNSQSAFGQTGLWVWCHKLASVLSPLGNDLLDHFGNFLFWVTDSNLVATLQKHSLEQALRTVWLLLHLLGPGVQSKVFGVLIIVLDYPRLRVKSRGLFRCEGCQVWLCLLKCNLCLGRELFSKGWLLLIFNSVQSLDDVWIGNLKMVIR